MRIGQTAFVDFISTLTASALGFVATIYIARVIGPEPLGIYYVVVGLVSVAALTGDVGVAGAVAKRVSEGTDQFEYAVAGASIIGSLFVIVIISIMLFRSQIVSYVNYPAVGYIGVILLVVLLNGLLNSLLVGLDLVHISGMLSPLRVGGRALTQIGLVIAGMGTAALFLGHIFGFLIAVVVALYFVLKNLQSFSRPSKYHFEQIADFAKYAWLGRLRGQMFSYADVLILGYFVSSSLVGIYVVAWNISHLLITFSGSLITTLFPKMSSISAEKNEQAVSDLVEKSLGFAGLFLIPGLFGGILLSEQILLIYGSEFQQGSQILSILIVSNLLMGYQNQLTRTLSAVDRPELSFWVNFGFIISNVILNIFLISSYGWIGAAIATTVSVGLSLVLAYKYVNDIIEFKFPINEIIKQCISAGVMFIGVYILLQLEKRYHIIDHNIIVVITLVVVGATIYFIILSKMSTSFRNTVDRNIPFEIPLIT
jgi:O-antigen/teichoic acid export membrane protein